MPKSMKQIESTSRRFDDLNIGHGQDHGIWSLVEEWFESETAEFSIPFQIVEAFEYKDSEKRAKYGFGIIGEDIDDDAKYYVTFPATDKSGKPHAERQKIFQLFQDESTPITGCVMQRIDTGKANPFIKFISVEQMQEIQASEDSEDD